MTLPIDLEVSGGCDRRTALKLCAAAACGAWWCDGPPGGELYADESPHGLNRFPRVVHEYFVGAVQQAARRNRAAYDQLRTREDAEQHVALVRDKIRSCFGPEPERTPLLPEVTGVIERDAYRIEKIIFQSRPGFPVTANLYLPAGEARPRPGVVGSCGHSNDGKAEPAYQAFAQGLARLGYVCLIFDPIGQGERLQYVGADLQPRLGAGVAEHLYAGNQQFLVGEFFGMWRAWDGIRALDYLLTRSEVDPRHIGLTGNSGGGTMTTWLCGLEDRWTMAAPSCFVTTFRHNMENELPADTEQCPPRVLAEGLDHVDFLAALAPRPTLILAKERDFFDVRGALDAAHRLRKLYTLLDAEAQTAVFVGPTPHGFSQENREAMYQWFARATGAAPELDEPAITPEDESTLWCTPRGQVAALEYTQTVFTFTRAKARRLAEQRAAPTADALPAAVRDVLKLPADPADVAHQRPPYRILRPRDEPAYPLPYACTYTVETEPGMLAIVYWLSSAPWESRPPRRGPRALLYVPHRSSDQELRSEPLIAETMRQEPEVPCFTCDVRGIGESRPNTCGTDTFDAPYGCDYFYAIHSLMLDRPYLGQKTWDLLRVLAWLAGFGYLDVHLVATGWGTLPATFAALLAPQVTRVTLKHALTSYAELAEAEDYRWPLATFLPNVLAHFDLPDCYAALADKHLRQLEPWGPRAEQSPTTSANP